jgi:hypothetical protein
MTLSGFGMTLSGFGMTLSGFGMTKNVDYGFVIPNHVLKQVMSS